MSNLETRPPEVEVGTGAPACGDLEVLAPREVPLGGPRAMTVHRTLPQRSRSTIGAWCFLDHYGPDDVSATGGMRVPPHPHTGLQTVSWLFEGEIEHRDSVGSHAMVRPGEVNFMTAGRGISHSEVSTDATRILHGAQLWTALPDGARHGEPFFESHAIPAVEWRGATLHVFAGALAGVASPTTTFSPLVGAQLELPAGHALDVPVAASFEHGVLVDLGDVLVEGRPLARRELGYLAAGRGTIRIEAPHGARVLLLGGEPFEDPLVMWWNFVGRDHDEIVAFRESWQRDAIEATDAAGRFGAVAGYEGRPLPAPPMPTVRLRPRRRR